MAFIYLYIHLYKTYIHNVTNLIIYLLALFCILGCISYLLNKKKNRQKTNLLMFVKNVIIDTFEGICYLLKKLRFWEWEI